jgi:hypothetical protein
MTGLGTGGGPRIDWQGWRKSSRSGQNCPQCGAPMVNRTAFTECSSCHHIEHKATTLRERSTLDPLREKVEESIREALPETRIAEPRFITYELPSELNGERIALRGAAGLWIIVQYILAESHRHGYELMPFATLAVMLITLGVMSVALPQLKYAWGLVALVTGVLIVTASWLAGTGFANSNLLVAFEDNSGWWSVMYSALYFIWASWFLYREARMMQQ